VLVTPSAPVNPYMPASAGKRYDGLRAALAEDVRVKEDDLKSGQVPAEADMLLVMAPENLDDRQVFAIDQFLMQGGSVVIASSPFDVDIGNGLSASKKKSGLEGWLQHNGLEVADSMVLDPENAALPVPVRRQLGTISIQEIQMVPYPHFPDIRNEGLSATNPMTSSLNQLTLNWASPIVVDKEKNQGRTVSELMHSSPESWTSNDTNVLPDYERYPSTGFRPGAERKAELLAVAVQGSFESWYKGKQSPLLQQPAQSGAADSEPGAKAPKPADAKPAVASVIEHSSDSARLILVGSDSFASDAVLRLVSQGQGTLYTKPLAFMQNAVDWSLNNQGLMSIRGRARFARLLEPMPHHSQLFWEYLNYGLALLGLVVVWFWRGRWKRRQQLHYQAVLGEV